MQWIIRGAAAAWTAYKAYTDTFENDVEVATASLLPHWHRAVFVFSRSAPTGFSEDRAVFKLDMLRTDVSGPADPWTTTNFTDAETILDAFWATWRPFVPQYTTLIEYRWYRMAFNDELAKFPFQKTGPPVRFISRSSPGTSTFGTPMQLCCAVTLKTPIPKHWGRFYAPLASDALSTTTGRIPSSTLSTLGGAAETMRTALHVKNMALCTPITQVDKQAVRGLLGVRRIQVDDVPDVQRRRRTKHVSTRYISTA